MTIFYMHRSATGPSADFENMIPLLKDVHQKIVTPFPSQ